jgi:hypothetical protein
VVITRLLPHKKSGCKRAFLGAKVILAANLYQPRRNVYLFAANVYQQDELRGDNKVELSPQHRVELRGVKEVIRSFRALTKFTPLFRVF